MDSIRGPKPPLPRPWILAMQPWSGLISRAPRDALAAPLAPTTQPLNSRPHPVRGIHEFFKGDLMRLKRKPRSRPKIFLFVGISRALEHCQLD